MSNESYTLVPVAHILCETRKQPTNDYGQMTVK
jgi:hypothetical protein